MAVWGGFVLTAAPLVTCRPKQNSFIKALGSHAIERTNRTNERTKAVTCQLKCNYVRVVGRFRALWLNLPGLTFLLTLCSLCGMVVYAQYKDCDPLTTKGITRDQVPPPLVFLFFFYTLFSLQLSPFDEAPTITSVDAC